MRLSQPVNAVLHSGADATDTIGRQALMDPVLKRRICIVVLLSDH